MIDALSLNLVLAIVLFSANLYKALSFFKLFQKAFSAILFPVLFGDMTVYVHLGY